MEKGLGFSLNSQSDTQIVQAFEFWNLGKGFKCIESLEEGLLTETSVNALHKHYSDIGIQSQDDFNLKLVNRWKIKHEMFKKVGISVLTGGSSYQKKDIQYAGLGDVFEGQTYQEGSYPAYLEGMGSYWILRVIKVQKSVAILLTPLG